MDFNVSKLVFYFLLLALTSLVAIFAYYVVTVCLWLAYKANGGRKSYLRYLTIKNLHIVNIK